MASRLFLGVWGFPEALGISGICFTVAIYLFVRSGGRVVVPDGAAMLDRAQRFVTAGKVPRAISVLTRTIVLDPNFWQAHELRGRLRATQGEYVEALKDFSEAIRLAPRERHLYFLRAQVYDHIGQNVLAQQDYEAAHRLGDV